MQKEVGEMHNLSVNDWVVRDASVALKLWQTLFYALVDDAIVCGW